MPATEVGIITVDERLHGHSKKPAVFGYGLGFTNANAHVAALSAARDRTVGT